MDQNKIEVVNELFNKESKVAIINDNAKEATDSPECSITDVKDGTTVFSGKLPPEAAKTLMGVLKNLVPETEGLPLQ